MWGLQGGGFRRQSRQIIRLLHKKLYRLICKVIVDCFELLGGVIIRRQSVQFRHRLVDFLLILLQMIQLYLLIFGKENVTFESGLHDVILDLLPGTLYLQVQFVF